MLPPNISGFCCLIVKPVKEEATIRIKIPEHLISVPLVIGGHFNTRCHDVIPDICFFIEDGIGKIIFN